MRATIIALVTAGAASPALAHPHIFVDAAVEVVFNDEGRAKGLRLTWTYDDLISLTLLSERGMDADFDGVLTAEELTQLNGFDMNWQPGFLGDTYGLINGNALILSGPSDWTVSYADAKLTTTHYRSFEFAIELDDQPLIVQAYDPGYYTSYAVVSARVTGRDDCTVELFEPDREAADQILEDALAEYSGTDGAEAEFPAIGSAYAEEARVTCAAR
jgi:ABC-type uncharacterized transport system substrate-binding protein